MKFDSIFHSGAITCFTYPSANRTLLLQEHTGHLGAQPVETHVYPTCFWSSLFSCFVRHFEFSSGLPLYTNSQTPVPCFPYPVPVFPVLVTSPISKRFFFKNGNYLTLLSGKGMWNVCEKTFPFRGGVLLCYLIKLRQPFCLIGQPVT